MDTCKKCGTGKLILERTNKSVDIPGIKLPCMIENILVQRCENCGEQYFGKESNDYIDGQVAIFKNEGIEIKIPALYAQKNTNATALAESMGLTRQNLYRKFTTIQGVGFLTILQIAQKLEAPLSDVFSYYPIKERNGMLFLIRDAGVL